MRIHERFATAVRVFPADVLPIDLLASGAIVAALSKEYGFGDFSPQVNEGRLESITFRRGLYFPDDDRQVAIKSVILESRKVAVSVLGTDEDATVLFDRLVGQFKELRPEIADDMFVPLVANVEAAVAFESSLDFSALISPTLLTFMDNVLVPACESKYGTPRLHASRIAIAVEYTTNSDVTERGASLLARDIVIEPRASTDPRERVFFARAPMPTSMLISALEMLERVTEGARSTDT